MILRLVEPDARGEIRLLPRPLTGAQADRHRWSSAGLVQPIFQNPFEAFSAYLPVETYLRRTALTSRSPAPTPRRGDAADQALRSVGLGLDRVARQVRPPVLRRRAAAHQRRPGADPQPASSSSPTSRSAWSTPRCG